MPALRQRRRRGCDTECHHAILATDPEPFQVTMWVTGSRPQIQVERLASPAAERQRPLPATLADHPDHVVLAV
jgi:hypothetical protein